MKRNDTIGRVRCPMSGCTELADVRKFAPRHARDTGRRLAGKLYLDCKRHGRLGVDGRMNEWILENAELSAEAAQASPPSPAPASAPAAPRPHSDPPRSSSTSSSARGSPPPSPPPAPAQAPTAPQRKKQGWGFFDA